jgi:hypothetical protein
MVGGTKEHGFDLESAHLQDFDRMSRLILGVCLVYVWSAVLPITAGPSALMSKRRVMHTAPHCGKCTGVSVEGTGVSAGDGDVAASRVDVSFTADPVFAQPAT